MCLFRLQGYLSSRISSGRLHIKQLHEVYVDMMRESETVAMVPCKRNVLVSHFSPQQSPVRAASGVIIVVVDFHLEPPTCIMEEPG